jgi:hypothetical protein
VYWLNMIHPGRLSNLLFNGVKPTSIRLKVTLPYPLAMHRGAPHSHDKPAYTTDSEITLELVRPKCGQEVARGILDLFRPPLGVSPCHVSMHVRQFFINGSIPDTTDV